MSRLQHSLRQNELITLIVTAKWAEGAILYVWLIWTGAKLEALISSPTTMCSARNVAMDIIITEPSQGKLRSCSATTLMVDEREVIH